MALWLADPVHVVVHSEESGQGARELEPTFWSGLDMQVGHWGERTISAA